MTISTTTSGASIHYTTDGSTPSSTVGTLYSGPVSVSSSMTLKAIAYGSGLTNSAVASAAYTITSGGGPPWYNSSWTNRKSIAVDHTKVSGAGNLTNFPMLFSVTDLNLRTVANGGSVGKVDGTDLLFTAGDGVTKLNHELELYNASTGQVIAWVRLQALSPTTDTFIYVYYGNASAADQQNKSGVWDSNYNLVWHLGNGTTLSGADSTNNGNNGTAYGPAAAGEIGGGAGGDVEGVSSAIPGADQTRTLECWFKITGNSGSDQVLCGMGYGTATGSIFSLIYRAAGSTLTLDAKGIVQGFSWSFDSNWHHLAAAYTSGSGLQNAVLYLDGASQTTTGGTGSLATPLYTYVDVRHSPAYALNDMTGVVDEFRISNIARPATWIATEFNNQNSPGTFFSMSGQETSGGQSQAATPTFAPPPGTYSSAQSVTISTTTSGASIHYTIDGSTPSSTAGTPYSGPVSVSSSMTLKAVAFNPGMADSPVATASYTITSAWFDPSWTNRKSVTVDHTKVSGAGSLTNFPMLFSVTDLSLRTVANGGSVGKVDGTDILFTASDGVTKLDHELDAYSSSTGQINAWVRLPALSPTADTVIYVYYGNASAVDQQNKSGVWDSNYNLVWHLGNGTTLSGADSTSYGNNGTVYGPAAAGIIGGGAGGDVEGLSGTVPDGDQTRTLECWFKITGNTGSDQVLCGMGYNSGTGTIFSLMYRATTSTLSVDALGIAQSFSWTADSNWHHLAAAYTSGSGLQNAVLYLDGVPQTTTGGTGTLATQGYTYIDVRHSPAYPYNDMTGVVDEFRISNIARPAAWIATQYNNQSSPGTFFRVGLQE